MMTKKTDKISGEALLNDFAKIITNYANGGTLPRPKNWTISDSERKKMERRNPTPPTLEDFNDVCDIFGL